MTQTESTAAMADDATDFTEALRQYMRLRKMTKDELARRIGRSPATLTNWTKKNSGRVPSLGDAIAMEDALDMPRGSLTRFLGRERDGGGKETTVEESWEYHYSQWVRLAPVGDDERETLTDLMNTFIRIRQELEGPPDPR